MMCNIVNIYTYRYYIYIIYIIYILYIITIQETTLLQETLTKLKDEC